MYRSRSSRAHLLFLLGLAALPGCRDDADSPAGPRPQFAQGDNGVWTVNSLLDPGDGTCDDAECTLREAIAAAASGDRIVFGGLQGDITLTAGQLDVSSKSLAIEGAGRIAVDAQSNSRVILVVGTDDFAPTVTLAGLTLKNGAEQIDAGGGIGASKVTLTLDRVTLSNNFSHLEGGGIALFNAEATIRNSVIDHNSSQGKAGGIYIEPASSLTLTSSTVESNEAQSTGGGIYNDGTLSITASTIAGNTASNPSATDAVGAGIYNGEGATATIVRSTISGNRAVDGGMAAGGIFTFGTVELRSSTVTRNTGPRRETGGIMVWVPGALTMSNSIVAGNVVLETVGTETVETPDDCARVNGGVITTLGHNLTRSCVPPTAGDVQVIASQIFTEVLEENLADNGGPTKTHALIARGRAIDAGYCPGETTDQRGFARPVDVALMPNALDACDIGPYEAQGPVAIVSDLMISQAVNKTSVKQGELLTYTVRVQNLGPETAPNVVVTDLLPTGATFVSARQNKGSTTAPPAGQTGTVTWTLGDLVDQANEVATITVTVLVRGRTTITNTASVTGDVADPNAANNTAAIRVSVAAGSSKPGTKK